MSSEMTIANIAAVDIAERLRLTLDRLETGDTPDYELAFDTPDGGDNFPAIGPDAIPALIDTLTELYRVYHEHAYYDDMSDA